MRLIDADELITAFPCGESVRTESVRATINHMSAIDIVLCKDCKWAEPNREGDYDCKCHIPTFRVPKDGYCNFGERKDNE